MWKDVDPKTLRNWLVLAGIAYFLFPADLIPDVLGLPGRVDDVVTMGLLTWFYRSHLRHYVEAEEEAGSEGEAGAGGPANARREAPFDAYQVLQVDRSASPEGIKAAYRARMAEYHPDKVAHLGEDLQKLAHERAQDIQRAYELLKS